MPRHLNKILVFSLLSFFLIMLSKQEYFQNSCSVQYKCRYNTNVGPRTEILTYMGRIRVKDAVRVFLLDSTVKKLTWQMSVVDDQRVR